MTQPTIGFIGAGNMAASLIGGLVARGFTPQQLCAADPNAAGLQALAAQHGIHACTSNAEVAQRADILVLAVKPQVPLPPLGLFTRRSGVETSPVVRAFAQAIRASG